MIITTLFYFPFVYLAIVVLKNYPLCYKIYRFWAWSILLPIGIIPLRKMKGKLPEKNGYIIVSNHTSQLDIVVPYTLLGDHFSFLAKKELKKVPLFKTNFRGMNVTVDRKSLVSGMDSLTECSEKIGQGINMLIFPEGTRSKKAPEMQKFKELWPWCLEPWFQSVGTSFPTMLRDSQSILRRRDACCRSRPLADPV